jgi:hypothetical protein
VRYDAVGQAGYGTRDAESIYCTVGVQEDIVAQQDPGIAARSSEFLVWSNPECGEPRTDQKEDTIN